MFLYNVIVFLKTITKQVKQNISKNTQDPDKTASIFPEYSFCNPFLQIATNNCQVWIW